jgi:hypothetical protein
MEIKKIAAFEKTLSFRISMPSAHKFKILLSQGTRNGILGDDRSAAVSGGHGA